jgi:hypothetical protein
MFFGAVENALLNSCWIDSFLFFDAWLIFLLIELLSIKGASKDTDSKPSASSFLAQCKKPQLPNQRPLRISSAH